VREEPRWRPLIAEDEIPEDGFTFTYQAGPFTETGILVRTARGVRAWRNLCRHLSVPLDHADPGRVITGDRRHLVCSQHGALYRPEDGLCIAGPCRGAALRPLQIAVTQGMVCLDISSLPDPLNGFRSTP
jgi:nitrite reductase/ring-hydroxylating ferredoxin subunit